MTRIQASKYFGSGRKLARALGIRPHAVYQWGKRPPLLRQYQIEAITGGALKADRPKNRFDAGVK